MNMPLDKSGIDKRNFNEELLALMIKDHTDGWLSKPAILSGSVG